MGYIYITYKPLYSTSCIRIRSTEDDYLPEDEEDRILIAWEMYADVALIRRTLIDFHEYNKCRSNILTFKPSELRRVIFDINDYLEVSYNAQRVEDLPNHEGVIDLPKEAIMLEISIYKNLAIYLAAESTMTKKEMQKICKSNCIIFGGNKTSKRELTKLLIAHDLLELR